MTMAAAITDALDIALRDTRVVLMGEDVAQTGGVFRITDGLLEKHGSERVIDTPVAESGIVGAALGMAISGLRPIAEIQFMGFSYPAFDQVISHVGRMRNRSRHRFTAPLVIRIPFGAGIGAAEHHSESAEAIYVHTPGLKVVVPATASDAKGLLLSAVEDPDPVVFLEPIRMYRAATGDVASGHYTVPLGAARLARPGEDVTIVTYGAMLSDCLAAADQLESAGATADVIDLRTLVPWDVDFVVESVKATGRLVVVHEGPRTAGFGAEIAAELQERALYSLLAPIERVTGWDTVVPLRRSERHYVPSAGAITKAAMRTLEG